MTHLEQKTVKLMIEAIHAADVMYEHNSRGEFSYNAAEQYRIRRHACTEAMAASLIASAQEQRETPMTTEDWKELNAGDVLVNRETRQAYIVGDAQTFDGAFDDAEDHVVVLTRTVIAREPKEWVRMRKTVDVEASNG